MWDDAVVALTQRANGAHAMNTQLSATEMALVKQIAELKLQLEAANKPKAITMKVSEKGALSLYGLGRFPITLYRGQIERLLGHADAIRAFIKANEALLSVKS
jgi:hypothetical protein